jgi:glycosyltransferase involved in cell wall biosynthesis
VGIKVSIIIPVYNAGDQLTRTLGSAAEQGWSNKEIIIIDDFSTDKSWDIAEQFQSKYPGNVKIFKNAVKGGNYARNYGFSLSSGTYIQWLDADDIIMPGKIEAQVAFLEKHTEFDGVYSDWQLDTYNGPQLVRTEFKKCSYHKNYLVELLKDNWSPPHSYLLRRSAVELVSKENAWNPTTVIAQDREFYTRCAMAGARFGYVEGNYCIYNRWLKVKSVSRSLTPDQKAMRLNGLLYDFIHTIENHGGLDPKEKMKCKKILQTQILYNASVYGFPLDKSEFSILGTNWLEIKGIRSKLKVIKRLLM